jgi:hypothetical protein
MNVNAKYAVLAARVPVALIKQLDKRAKQSGRSRSAEVLMRLRQSLKEVPLSMAAHDAPAGAGLQVNGAAAVTHER